MLFPRVLVVILAVIMQSACSARAPHKPGEGDAAPLSRRPNTCPTLRSVPEWIATVSHAPGKATFAAWPGRRHPDR